MLVYNNYSKIQDIDLLYLCQSGNETAFSEMYSRYFQKLISYACKQLNNIAAAEDLVQDVFLSLYSKRVSLKIEHSLYAYLIQSIKYKIINLRRKKIVQDKFEKNTFFSPICENDFAKNEDYTLTSKKLQIALGKMSVKCRDAFLLSRDGGLSQKEIASKMDISTSTVEKHIVKALRIVRQELLV